MRMKVPDCFRAGNLPDLIPLPHAKKILCALPTLGHPRHAKRISMLQEAGFEVEVVAFKRPYHEGRLPDCNVTTLGEVNHGNYLSRSFKILSAFPKIRSAIKRNDLVFAFGPDMAAACHFSSRLLGKPLVFEVGDITRAQLASGIKGRLVRALDRYVTNRSSLIVATSPRFLDTYYQEWIKTGTPGLLIENKLEAAFCAKMKSEIANTKPPKGIVFQDRPLRIGYFGYLRNEWSLSVLKRLAIKYPQRFEIVIAGYPKESAQELLTSISELANVDYRGQYKSPEDLPSLYRDVDMVWACYQPLKSDEWGYLWARPNRFYQGCMFRKPFFSRGGCLDGSVVAEHGIGKIINDEEIEKTVDDVASIAAADVETWSQNISTIPENVFAYTNEVAELKSAIHNILSGR